jgi:hypothetical protein
MLKYSSFVSSHFIATSTAFTVLIERKPANTPPKSALKSQRSNVLYAVTLDRDGYGTTAAAISALHGGPSAETVNVLEWFSGVHTPQC